MNVRPGSGGVKPLSGWLRVAAFGVAALLVHRYAPLLPAAWTAPLQEGTAAMACAAIRLGGLSCTPDGAIHLVLANHVLRIDLACTAIVWVLLFVTLVAVVPVLGARKRVALLAGPPLILAANLARLVALAAVSEHAPGRFYAVHDRVLQSSMAVFVAALWGLWMWRVRDDWQEGWS